MPSERPRMPSETYESMLRAGHSKGLGLQAYEVAAFSKKNYIGKILVVCLTIVTVIMMTIGIAVVKIP